MNIWGDLVRVWGCARSRRRIGNYDAPFGRRFKHAQMKAASRFFISVLVSLSNSNRKVLEKLAQHECTLAAIQERVEAVKRQCESANTAKMAQRTEMDNIAIHINNTIVDIANGLTKKNSNDSDQSKSEKSDKLTNKKINAIKHRSAKALQLPKYQAHPFKEAMKTRADIQLLLSEAEGLLTVIRRTSTNVCNHTDHTIKGKPIQMSQKVKLESRSKTTTVIHSYNQTVDKIVSKLQKLQSQVEDDIQEERQVLQSSEKIANKHYGFNIMMYLPRKLPAFLWKTLRLIWRGRLRMDEHVEQGIGAFPRAMETMFEGGHIGKLLVNVGAPVASASA